MALNVESLSNILLYCGFLGTIAFIIKTFLPVDFGAEVQTDFTTIADYDTSFHIFTLESIFAFFMCSGWMGWISLAQLHYSVKLSLSIAIISGIIGMLFFAWLIAQFKKLEHVPTHSYDELKDKIGKAYLNFAPKGNGKIQIEFNGKLDTLEATNNTDEEIKSFDSIKVVKIENNIIYIEKA